MTGCMRIQTGRRSKGVAQPPPPRAGGLLSPVWSLVPPGAICIHLVFLFFCGVCVPYRSLHPGAHTRIAGDRRDLFGGWHDRKEEEEG